MSLEFVADRAEKGHEKGLWKEYKDDITGESTYKEHRLKKLATYCPENDHFWEQKNREAVCKICGLAKPFVVGAMEIKNGKIINKI